MWAEPWVSRGFCIRSRFLGKEQAEWTECSVAPVCTLKPKSLPDSIRRLGLWKVIGSCGWSPLTGIVSPIKEPQRACSPPAMEGHTADNVYDPGSSLTRPRICEPWDLGLPEPRELSTVCAGYAACPGAPYWPSSAPAVSNIQWQYQAMA